MREQSRVPEDCCWAALHKDQDGGDHGEDDLQNGYDIKIDCAEFVWVQDVVYEDCNGDVGKLKEPSSISRGTESYL